MTHPPGQFNKLLNDRNAEILAKLPQADPQEKQILLKEMDAIKEKNKNLEQAKEAYEKKLAETAQASGGLSKSSFLPVRSSKPREALSRGETKAAAKPFPTGPSEGSSPGGRSRLQPGPPGGSPHRLRRGPALLRGGGPAAAGQPEIPECCGIDFDGHGKISRGGAISSGSS